MDVARCEISFVAVVCCVRGFPELSGPTCCSFLTAELHTASASSCRTYQVPAEQVSGQGWPRSSQDQAAFGGSSVCVTRDTQTTLVLGGLCCGPTVC